MDYLLKANAIIVLFYFCYKLFLQKETFFESNRYFLLLGLALASIIPFIVIPVYIEKTIIGNFIFDTTKATQQNDTIQTFSFFNTIQWIYILGTSFFAVKFLIELNSLLSILIHNKRQKQDKYIFIETKKEHSPFSFFRYIVYNSNHFTSNELNHIILHEKVHANQYHSVDILLTKVASILFWFNPFIWLYNKSLQQNLEFIADDKTQKTVKNPKSYQSLLLKTILPKYQLILANNFYNSLIKKRIIMLHKSKSNKLNTWKYALVIPFLALFLMSFNTKEIIIPIENKAIAETPFGDTEVAIINKNATDAELENIKKQFKKHGIKLYFKNIKRNKNNEITKIKISAETKNSKTKYEADSDNPITNIKIKYESERNSISIGSTSKSSHEYHFASEDHVHKKHKAKKTKVYMVEEHKEHSDDDEHEHEIEVIVENGKNKVHKLKKRKKDGRTLIIKTDGNEDEVIEIQEKKSNVFIITDEDGKTIKKEIIIEESPNDENTWIHEDKNVINLGNSKTKVFISGDSEKKPLIIIDGKEADSEKLNSLKSDSIESMTVLKGNSATKKHGNKAKDGVIEVTTKE